MPFASWSGHVWIGGDNVLTRRNGSAGPLSACRAQQRLSLLPGQVANRVQLEGVESAAPTRLCRLVDQLMGSLAEGVGGQAPCPARRVRSRYSEFGRERRHGSELKAASMYRSAGSFARRCAPGCEPATRDAANWTSYVLSSGRRRRADPAPRLVRYSPTCVRGISRSATRRKSAWLCGERV